MCRYLKDNGVTFSKLWLDVEGTGYWKDSFDDNKKFMTSLLVEIPPLSSTNFILQIAAVDQTGPGRKDIVGIYSSKHQWKAIFGSEDWVFTFNHSPFTIFL